MKTVAYEGQFNISLLMEELLEAFPHWIRTEGEWKVTEVIISSSLTGVELTVPDADVTGVEVVVAAHDPGQKSKSQIKVEKLASDRTAGLAKLKVAGLTDDELKALFG